MSETTDSDAPKRRGRRRAGADTRSELLDAAMEEFRLRGYNGATVRAIAARAQVDPAMVNHWFGSKEGLFTAAVSLPVNLGEMAREVTKGAPEQLGERIVRAFLTVWDTAGGGRFAAMMRSFALHEGAGAMLREFVATALFGTVLDAIDADQRDLRMALCASQVMGLGLARYVIELEPLASADHKAVVLAIAPTLQRYLTGEVSDASNR